MVGSAGSGGYKNGWRAIGGTQVKQPKMGGASACQILAFAQACHCKHKLIGCHNCPAANIVFFPLIVLHKRHLRVDPCMLSISPRIP